MLNYFEKLFLKGSAKNQMTKQAARQNALGLILSLDGVLAYLIMDKKMDLANVIAF